MSILLAFLPGNFVKWPLDLISSDDDILMVSANCFFFRHRKTNPSFYSFGSFFKDRPLFSSFRFVSFRFSLRKQKKTKKRRPADERQSQSTNCRRSLIRSSSVETARKKPEKKEEPLVVWFGCVFAFVSIQSAVDRPGNWLLISGEMKNQKCFFFNGDLVVELLRIWGEAPSHPRLDP